ncbi:WD40-like Beta Propeller Repeat [Lentzea fradiae]|uniref:WD40-like Beta Propeller Repeat n=1 Tax=Lentzea fradiae TaxID=200378 RepID=A0A1G7U9B9_9PSEU|nr:VWA domain-containing protein [Lentzea fradiae]SDG43988.1 WD40-like Beta Propeller Repeat [Lentzea fradiae]
MRALPLLLVALLVAPVPVAHAQPPATEPFDIGFVDDGDVFTVDSNGSARTALTDDEDEQRDPAFSFDGTRIAYSEEGRVMIADANGSGARRLNDETLRQTEPAWSPDGTQIALVTWMPDGEGSTPVVQVYRVADGVRTGEIPVPEYLVAEDTQPDWSPDGATIAITRRAETSYVDTPQITEPRTDRPERVAGTFDVEQFVRTPRVPPKPDVVVLIDISGSMSQELDSVKRTLDDIIAEVRAQQPDTRFGIGSYAGPENEGRTFTVHVPLTEDVGDWQDRVNIIVDENSTEVWAHALMQTATGAFGFRPDSSRVVVVIGDEGTAEGLMPGGTDTVTNAIAALRAANIRFVGIDSGGLDQFGQATRFVAATNGSLKTYDENRPGEISTAILDGIRDLDVKVTPVPRCDGGLGLTFDPAEAVVRGGEDARFTERFEVSANAVPGSTVRCTVEFRLNNEQSARSGYVQDVEIQVADRTRPLVRIDDVTSGARDGNGTNITYKATATDGQNQPLTPTCTPPSGTTFPIGVTTVTCTATDEAGNTGTDTAVVTITAESDGVAQIWLVTPDGRNQVNLTPRFEGPCGVSSVPSFARAAVLALIDTRDPAWAPDGRHLAVTQDGRVCEVSSDGTLTRVLVQGDDEVIRPRNPVWVPDGSGIVFESSHVEAPPELWTVRGDAAPRLLTRDAAQPTVQRLPRLTVTTTATPREIPFNGETTIEVTVANTGFATAPAVLTVTLPPGLTGGPRGADLGPIPPGQQRVVSGEATGVTAGEHVVTAAVGAITSATTVTVLERTGSLSLKVTAAPQPAYVGGEDVVVKFALFNSSGSTLTDVRVIASGFGCLPDCPVGTLGPDAGAEVELRIPATEAVDRELVAVVVATGPDEDSLDNVSATRVVVRQPVLTLDQQAGPLGGVVSVQGKDFPPGAKVRLDWSPGIAETPGELTTADGTFTTQMLVFHNDIEGVRQATATSAEGTRFGEVRSGDFLAVPNTVQPLDFVERG